MKALGLVVSDKNIFKTVLSSGYIKQLLFEYGFGVVWISQDVGDCNSFVKAFRIRLIEYYTQRWHGHVPDSSR